MKRQSYFSNYKKIINISFGLVATFFLLWLIFHTKQFVPEKLKDLYYTVFIAYGVMGALAFGSADIRNKLYNVRFIDFVPRFLIFFGVSYFVFSLILAKISLLPSSYFGFLQSVPIWLGCIHAFVFATIESAVWQGYLDEKIGHPWSELSAGLFHWGVWSGGAIVVIPSAAILFFIFSFANWYFRNSKNDLAPAIGVHSAFNYVKLGLMFVGGK